MKRGFVSLHTEMIVLNVLRLPLIVGFLVSAALVIRVPFSHQSASATPPAPGSATHLSPPSGEPHDAPPADSPPDPPRQLAAERSSQGEFCLSNLDTTGGDIHYVVNCDSYVLRPGETHRFSGGTVCHVQFHRGGQFGYAGHVLSPGDYAFKVGSHGWDLVDARTDRPVKP